MRLTMLTAPAVIAMAAAAAPAAHAAHDGVWIDRSGRTDVRVRVEDGRVVAARGSVATRPAADWADPAVCDTRTFAFVGPLEPGDRSTARGFELAQGPYLTMTGRIRSATRITGRIEQVAEGGRFPCRGTVRFALSPA